MFIFQEKYYFITPVTKNNNDMDFNIYDENGEFYGSMMHLSTNKLPENSEEFLERLENYCVATELTIRSKDILGMEIKEFIKTKSAEDEVIDTLVNKLNFSYETILDFAYTMGIK